MQNYSNATIEGRATRDPIKKTTKTGKTVCTFSLAINHYTKADTEPKVSFVEVETWEKTADFCMNNVTKGKKIMIIGALRQDRWEGKDGKIQSRLKIIGNEIRFLEQKKNKEQQTKPE